MLDMEIKIKMGASVFRGDNEKPFYETPELKLVLAFSEEEAKEKDITGMPLLKSSFRHSWGVLGEKMEMMLADAVLLGKKR